MVPVSDSRDSTIFWGLLSYWFCYILGPTWGLVMQNTSHAVMAQRTEPIDSPDDFPTPPWATRALVEHVLGNKDLLRMQTCLEPACGAGHMAKVLKEYFGEVHYADAYKYEYGPVCDFLTDIYMNRSYDWVITNPPFRLAEEFVLHALNVARVGVAILARTVFLESAGRYKAIFRERPPSQFAQFVERVPIVKGRLDGKATTATGYAWFVWEHQAARTPCLTWVPPCRRVLERHGDYENVNKDPRIHMVPTKPTKSGKAKRRAPVAA